VTDVPLPQGRSVRARRQGRGVVWFDFGELCGQAHGKADLVEIARNFHTVLLSGVPMLGADNADQARRLIWLIDEFYDRRVKLVLSAAAAPDQLCSGGSHVGRGLCAQCQPPDRDARRASTWRWPHLG
jgi:cell division protein ZapE